MTVELLHRVFLLNNKGVHLLCSSSLNETKLAMKCFNEAVKIASSFEAEDCDPKDDMDLVEENALQTGIWDLCSFVRVPIPSLDDATLYLFDNGIYLKPEIFLDYMGCNQKKSMEFFASVVLLNTALACGKLAHVRLAKQEDAAVGALFCKASYFYKSAYECLVESGQGMGQKNVKVVSFFMLAAQNNYSCLCLKLERHSDCRSAQAIIKSFIDHARRFLPMDASPFVEEMFLNNTILEVTGCFSSLAAATA
jgi:hypothetical protein